MQSLVSTISPTDSSVPLRIAEMLAAAFPGLARKPFAGLNVETFRRRGLCSLTWRTAPLPAEEFHWTGLEHNSLERAVSCGVADVEWQGETFVLAMFHWQIGYNRESQSWLMARDEGAIDRFALEIYQVTNVPHEAVLVFAGGCWNEDHNLYRSIQSSS
ncbi:MAG: hypothetical protein RL291_58, partial [Pseudomonadota bacterium]